MPWAVIHWAVAHCQVPAWAGSWLPMEKPVPNQTNTVFIFRRHTLVFFFTLGYMKGKRRQGVRKGLV